MKVYATDKRERERERGAYLRPLILSPTEGYLRAIIFFVWVFLPFLTKGF